jgi:hypothetical protein
MMFLLASTNGLMGEKKNTLNFDKTNFIKFSTKNKTCVNLNIGHDDKSI